MKFEFKLALTLVAAAALCQVPSDAKNPGHSTSGGGTSIQPSSCTINSTTGSSASVRNGQLNLTVFADDSNAAGEILGYVLPQNPNGSSNITQFSMDVQDMTRNSTTTADLRSADLQLVGFGDDDVIVPNEFNVIRKVSLEGGGVPADAVVTSLGHGKFHIEATLAGLQTEFESLTIKRLFINCDGENQSGATPVPNNFNITNVKINGRPISAGFNLSPGNGACLILNDAPGD